MVFQQQSAMTRHALFMICLFLGLFQSGIAGSRDVQAAPEGQDDQLTRMGEDPEQVQGLENVSLEERLRLRMDLNHYSQTNDPAHHQIQDRRRAMSKGIQERFFRADRDNDNRLSRQETVDSLPQVARHFNQVDLDGDGFISISELVEYQARLIERQRAAELRLQQAREAELMAVQTAAEGEATAKSNANAKLKSKQAEIPSKPSL
ncbi:MAG TPA: EF-hand domain-containing protein [Methylophilaceae bacterium]|jgi:Ca2+-binding EF-hand superfamily protein